MIRTARLMLLVVALPVAFGACKKKVTPVVPDPTPTQPPTTQTPRVPTNPGNPSTPTGPSEAETTRIVREMLSSTLYFEYDSDELTAESRAKLDSKIPLLNANPDVRIRIDGHCDERGTDEYNLVLGRRRAEQAKRYLTDRGIDASRIETMSYGRERPIAQGSDESAWSQNRRDEFNIISGGNVLRQAR
jgi:peptidoglycan-associated lipoprotein